MIPQLSKRQKQVLIHITNGGSNKEFANLHKLSEKTVEAHRYELYNTLNIHSMVLLTHYALTNKYITLKTNKDLGFIT